jgi:hypothetical protein
MLRRWASRAGSAHYAQPKAADTRGGGIVVFLTAMSLDLLAGCSLRSRCPDLAAEDLERAASDLTQLAHEHERLARSPQEGPP